MTNWKAPAIPRSVVQTFVFDKEGRFLLMHRSNKVRSARNVWSIPSGVQDIGETQEETLVRELKEEFDLVPKAILLIGLYDNIAGDTVSYCRFCDSPSHKEHTCHLLETQIYQPAPEQYHWVISLFLVEVDSLLDATNMEPDKHDVLAIIQFDEILHDDFQTKYPMHPTLTQWLTQHKEILYGTIVRQIQTLPMLLADVQEELNN